MTCVDPMRNGSGGTLNYFFVPSVFYVEPSHIMVAVSPCGHEQPVCTHATTWPFGLFGRQRIAVKLYAVPTKAHKVADILVACPFWRLQYILPIIIAEQIECLLLGQLV